MNAIKDEQQGAAESHFFFFLKGEKSKDEIILLATTAIEQIKGTVKYYKTELSQSKERDEAILNLLILRHFYRHLIYLANNHY